MDSVSMSNEKSTNLQVAIQTIITTAFIIGLVANVAVLWILYKSSKVRNSKHVFMLRCLVCNDVIAQCGMLLLMYLNRFDIIPVHWRCALFVWLRGFGIGSGCVALTMAIERWLALTKPFVYQTIVTHRMIRRCMGTLWIVAIGITYLPLLGFGQYYDDGKCARYREATVYKDICYAYVFFIFGSAIILGIIWCNVSVTFELWKIRRTQRLLLRRSSKTEPRYKYSTSEEISFSKFMIAICLIFIICWMPQMISIPMAQNWKETGAYKILGKISDLLLVIYFALDPYVYVLQQYTRKKSCKPFCGKTNNNNSGSRSISLNATTQTSNGQLQNLVPTIREKV
ncbi:hypothetical protein FQA39_LY06481 [Lamprigera yunnana]|nr:hypothetical protein FQA39_LY06481 [Lamprigera yunnana]